MNDVSILNVEQINELTKMINSNDPENRVVAFEYLKNLTVKDNWASVMIIMLNTRTIHSLQDWDEHIPKFYKGIMKRIDITDCTLNDIMKCFIRYKVPKEIITLYINFICNDFISDAYLELTTESDIARFENEVSWKKSELNFKVTYE